MSFAPRSAFISLVLLFAACADTGKPDQFGNIYEEPLPWTIVFPEGGYTYAMSSRSKGISLHHLAEDGAYYAWGANGSRVVKGAWRKQGNGMCYSSDFGMRNPGTGEVFQPGEEACFAREQLLNNIISRVEGDPFSLSSDIIPSLDLTQCRLPEPMRLMTTRWSCTPAAPAEAQAQVN